MIGESSLLRAYAVVTLSETRAQLRNWWGSLMVASIGALFAFISMLVGQMLVLQPIVGGDYYVSVLLADHATQWWDYPAILAVQPWGVVTLPFLSTVSMVLVSFGVGLGMSVAILIGVRMIRLRRRNPGASTALGAATGLTPAMIALVTLGACCSTTAAATAGIAVAAQTSGSTVNALLLNNWYLNIFQLIILWVALIAQEQLLTVYGVWFTPGSSRSAPAGLSHERFALAKGLARLALLVGGITWSLTTLADWTVVDPLSAGVGMWIHWLVQQQVPAILAVSLALAPAGVAQWVARRVARWEGWLLRGLLFAVGVSLVTWMPPPLVAAGIVGWGNELLGSLGASTALGAAPIGPFTGWGLVFHWTFQLLLIGGVALAVAIAPARAVRSFAPALGPYYPIASPTPAVDPTVGGSTLGIAPGTSSDLRGHRNEVH